MAPLENAEPINSNSWEALSSSKTTRHGRGKRNPYPEEDSLIQSVLTEGKAFKLEYTTPEEAAKMQARLKDRAGQGVRVLTDESEPTALFIGPNIP